MQSLPSIFELSDRKVASLPFIIPAIDNPEGLPLIDIYQIPPLQEDEEGNSLKDFYFSDLMKLKRVLMVRGFRWPFFLFQLPNGKRYLGDGHGRRRLFMRDQPIDHAGRPLRMFPALTRSAINIQDAVIQLGELTSQMQKTTQEGIDWLKAYYKIPDEATVNNWSFQGIFNQDPEKEEQAPAQQKKPPQIVIRCKDEKHRDKLAQRFLFMGLDFTEK